MLKLKDIVVWRLKTGEVAICGGEENKVLARIINHKVYWNNKEECSAEVRSYIEEQT